MAKFVLSDAQRADKKAFRVDRWINSKKYKEREPILFETLDRFAEQLAQISADGEADPQALAALLAVVLREDRSVAGWFDKKLSGSTDLRQDTGWQRLYNAAAGRDRAASGIARVAPALVAAALALCATATASATQAGCSTDSNGQVACTVKTGLSGVTAVDHGTGLEHSVGLQDVDIISLPHACHLVRLYYLFGFQGDSHVLPPVNVPIRQAAITDGSPWTVRSPSWLTQRVRTLLRQYGLPGESPSNYSLPYPNSYWYVYVGHTEAEVLSRGGVRCVRLEGQKSERVQRLPRPELHAPSPERGVRPAAHRWPCCCGSAGCLGWGARTRGREIASAHGRCSRRSRRVLRPLRRAAKRCRSGSANPRRV